MGSKRILPILLLILSFHSCVDKQSKEKKIRDVEHIIMIGVDGLSTNGIKKANTPVLDSLISSGAYSFNARGVIPTSSGPNWASILMGADPAEHGVTSNSYDPDEPSLPPVASGKNPKGIFPNVFEVLKAHQKDWELGAIYNWRTIRKYISEGQLDHDENPDSDEEVQESVSDYFLKKAPKYLFVHFNDVDHAGHSYGHGSKEYLRSVGKVDSLIGLILRDVGRSPVSDKTLIMVTADHGGLGFGHNENVPEVIGVPLIMSGPGVKKGYQIQSPISTVDNSPTVAFALGADMPNVWTGRPIKTAFEGFESKLDYPRKKFYTMPRIDPMGDGFRPAGALYLDEGAEVAISTNIDDVKIRYTIDGTEPLPTSDIFETPFPVDHTTTVKAALYMDTVKVSNTNVGHFRLCKTSTQRGVNANIYYGHNLDRLPDIKSLKKVTTAKLYEFSSEGFEYPKGADQMTVHYVSHLSVEKPGEYTFYTESDDGSKLYVNGKEVVDNDGNHGVRPREGTVYLEKGRHKVEVAWYNSGGGLWLQTYIKGPGFHRQVLTTEMPKEGLGLHLN